MRFSDPEFTQVEQVLAYTTTAEKDGYICLSPIYIWVFLLLIDKGMNYCATFQSAVLDQIETVRAADDDVRRFVDHVFESLMLAKPLRFNGEVWSTCYTIMLHFQMMEEVSIIVDGVVVSPQVILL